MVAARGNSIAGYFPDDEDSLAVLSVPTFDPLDSDDAEFQDVLRSFLATSKAQGKSKLVIDLRGNGGGDVVDGYDMFKQLFPGMVPYGTTNLAASPLLNALDDVASSSVGN